MDIKGFVLPVLGQMVSKIAAIIYAYRKGGSEVTPQNQEGCYYEYKRDTDRGPGCWVNQNCVFPPHFHSSIELMYVTEGTLSVIVDGKHTQLHPGEFSISPSFAIHSYWTEGTSRSYVLTVPMESIPSYKSLLSKKTFARYFGEDHSHGELKRCMEALIRLFAEEEESSGDSVVRRNLMKGYLYVVISLILGETGVEAHAQSRDEFLAKNIHYQEKLTLDMLAQHFGYSTYRFSRLFHNYFGRGITECINSMRCREAAVALDRKKVSVTEIAMASGFESTRTFYREFKRYYGMTPTQYAHREKTQQLPPPENFNQLHP